MSRRQNQINIDYNEDRAQERMMKGNPPFLALTPGSPEWDNLGTEFNRTNNDRGPGNRLRTPGMGINMIGSRTPFGDKDTPSYPQTNRQSRLSTSFARNMNNGIVPNQATNLQLIPEGIQSLQIGTKDKTLTDGNRQIEIVDTESEISADDIEKDVNNAIGQEQPLQPAKIDYDLVKQLLKIKDFHTAEQMLSQQDAIDACIPFVEIMENIMGDISEQESSATLVSIKISYSDNLKTLSIIDEVIHKKSAIEPGLIKIKTRLNVTRGKLNVAIQNVDEKIRAEKRVQEQGLAEIKAIMMRNLKPRDTQSSPSTLSKEIRERVIKKNTNYENHDNDDRNASKVLRSSSGIPNQVSDDRYRYMGDMSLGAPYPNIQTVNPNMSMRNESYNPFNSYETNNYWQEIDYNGTNPDAHAAVQAILQIADITMIDINENENEVTLQALDRRDTPRLDKLKSIIVDALRKLSDNDPIMEQIKTAGYAAMNSATKHTRKLDRLIRIHGIHITSDNRTSLPLKLEPFSGFESESHIYDFFELFHSVCRGIKPALLGEYLYLNYLTTDVKSDCAHLKNDFYAMKKLLIGKYGNISRILREKRWLVKGITQPNFRSQRKAKLLYVRKVLEIVLQISSIAKISAEANREVHNANNVFDIVGTLPEYYRTQFNTYYVTSLQVKNIGEDMSGEETFKCLLDFLSAQIKAIEMMYMSEVPGDNTQSAPTPKREYNKAVNTAAKVEKYDSKDRPDRWGWAPCFMHEQFKKRVKDCNTGSCPLFLNADPSERLERAQKFRRCQLCLLRRCYMKDSNKCSYKTQVPKSIICQQCSNASVDRNILLCTEHRCDKDSVKEGLTRFLPKYEPEVEIKLLLLEILKIKCEPRMKRDLQIGDAFDVQKGTVFPSSEVAHKIQPEPELDPIYPMQILKIGEESILTMFDTGATNPVIKVDIAKKLKLKIIDDKPQYIQVASGSVISTGGGIYSIILGPDISGQYHELRLTSMTQITGEVPNYDLSKASKEFQANQSSTPLSKERLPPIIGGKDIGLLIGIKHSRLVPTLLLVLPSGLQVWKSRLPDINNSYLMFAGTHQSFDSQDIKAGRTNLNMRILFTSLYKSYLNSPFQDQLISPNYENECMCIEPQVTIDTDTPATCINKVALRTDEQELLEQEDAGFCIDFRCVGVLVVSKLY